MKIIRGGNSNRVRISYNEWYMIGEVFKLQSRFSGFHIYKTANSNEIRHIINGGGDRYVIASKAGGRYIYARHYIYARPSFITCKELRRRMELFGFDTRPTKGGSLDSDWTARRENTPSLFVGVKNWETKNNWNLVFRDIRRIYGEDFAEVLFSRDFDIRDLIEQGFNFKELRFPNPGEAEVIKESEEIVTSFSQFLNRCPDFLEGEGYSIKRGGKWYEIDTYDALDNIMIVKGIDNFLHFESNSPIIVSRTEDII